ncbi:TonB-dependent receptor domain-containing protein [Caulobacter sp. X]|uniref:TonB-dependent receptor domain-containing protein n=1 Tax=Caulobacter sp. X TaxID=2048901 RepID=UPI000C15250D|nr:TonB-dependent receptor [Caulobacter sp. X]PIC01749.1 TonB-dependent receptor [Caulobacter sp. X]
MKMKNFALATTALVGCLMAAGAAMAQSSGTTEVDKVVVTATGQKSIDGAVVAETAPKSRSTITQEYIGRQAAGQTIVQTLNNVPGLNFTNNDPYGNSGGNIRLRGFDGNRISLTFDGIPTNDTGNYALYSNQQLDPELIERANVTTGQTDVDTPTISATGGVINYTTLKPTTDMGATVDASYGSFNYRRFFGLIQTGEFGPWGTKAWASASYTKYDKFKGEGDLEKKQFNARIWQDIGTKGDYIALSAHWNENRNFNYNYAQLGTADGTILPETAVYGWDWDYRNNTSATTGIYDWIKPTAVAGSRDTDPNGSNWWGGRINPSNTGNIRLKSRFTLADSLIFTFDPSFQYVMANGGTQQVAINEYDAKLVGTATSFPTCKVGAISSTNRGVDLNGDGDCMDSVRYMSPSNTNTRRYGLNTSLIWRLNDDNTFRLAYTFDRGRHRQTSEAGYVDQSTGFMKNWFGGKETWGGDRIVGADGALLRFRDRFSIAELQQVALEYRGRFMDDKLNVTIGVQHKEFTRELNQYCYTSNGTSTVLCTTQTPNAALANGNVTFGTSSTQYIPPFAYNAKVKKTLPNVGLSYTLDTHNTFYASYSEQISALRTDSYYTVQRQTDGSIASLSAKPEATKTGEVGWRFNAQGYYATVSAYKTQFKNRVVSTYDPDSDTYRERNVGSVDIKGLEGQIGGRITPELSVAASATYTDAKYQDPLLVVKPNVYAPINGKQLVETPKVMFGGRINYEEGPFSFGIQGKYTGKRYATDMNDLAVDGYALFDLDVRYKLDAVLKGSYVQLNVWNIFDKEYYGSLGTQVTAASAATKTLYGITNQPYGYIGAPRTAQLTFRVDF